MRRPGLDPVARAPALVDGIKAAVPVTAGVHRLTGVSVTRVVGPGRKAFGTVGEAGSACVGRAETALPASPPSIRRPERGVWLPDSGMHLPPSTAGPRAPLALTPGMCRPGTC